MNTGRWERLGAYSGVALVILAVVGFALGGELPRGDSTTAARDYVAEHRNSLLVAAYVLSLAGVMILWFAAALRSYLRRLEGQDSTFEELVFGSGVAGGSLIFAGSGVIGALAWRSSGVVEPAVARALLDIGAVAYHAADYPLAVFMLAVGIASLRSGAFARWLGWASIISALFVLAVRAIPTETYGPETLGHIEFVLMMAWFATTSISLASRLGRGVVIEAARGSALR